MHATLAVVDTGQIVALFIAALALSVSAYSMRSSRHDAYTNGLERQVQELQGDQIEMRRDLDDCKRARDAFEDKNFQLLQEVYEMRKIVDGMRRHE